MYSIAHRVERAHDEGLWTVAWPSDIITGGIDEKVKIWSTAPELSPKHTLTGSQWSIVSVASNAPANLIASSSLGGQIKLWELNSGALIRTIEASPLEAWALSIRSSDDTEGCHIASSSKAGNINVWSSNTGEKIQTFEQSPSKFLLSVAYSPNGKYIACGAIDGTITVFDVPTGKRLHVIDGHSMAVRGLAFSIDSSLLITGSDDKHINIYDIGSASSVASLSGHASWVLSVAASPNGRTFASGSSDRKVKVWDLATRNSVYTFDNHQDQVWGVAYSPAGNQLASVSDDKQLFVYNCQ